MKKYLHVLLCLIVILLLGGCGFNEEKVKKNIEDHLYQKYNEQFEVTHIQKPPSKSVPLFGGGIYKITGKVSAHPINQPEWMFDVEYTKDMKTIWDTYLNHIMKERYDEAFHTLAQPIFGEDIFLSTTIDLGAYGIPDPTLTKETVSIENYDYYALPMTLYIQHKGAFDKKEEAKKIHSFAEKLVEFGVTKTSISFFYLSKEEFQQSEKVDKEVGNLYDYYRDQEKMVNEGYVAIEDNKIQQTIGEIENEFYFKNEK